MLAYILGMTNGMNLIAISVLFVCVLETNGVAVSWHMFLLHDTTQKLFYIEALLDAELRFRQVKIIVLVYYLHYLYLESLVLHCK